jgi:hypothetical protein
MDIQSKGMYSPMDLSFQLLRYKFIVFIIFSRITLPAESCLKYFLLIVRPLDTINADSPILLEKNIQEGILWQLLAIWLIHLP